MIGRFITPDTIVQAPQDPQTLNRYAYCRNNPVKYIDPSGHGFKKWFKEFFGNNAGWIGLAFGLIGLVAASIYTGNWESTKNIAISTATAFALSGGNPFATAAAFMATSTLDTEPGRQFTGFMSNEVFDDAFGMSPRAAYIVGNMVSHAIVASAYYIAITPASYKGPDYTDPANQKGEISKYGVEEGNAQPGGSTANYIAEHSTSTTKSQWHPQGRVASDIAWKGTPVVDKVFETLNVRHAAAVVNKNGTLFDSAQNISLKNLLKGRVYGSPWTAISHQAFFRTMIQGGMSGTQALGAATSQAGWSFYVTSSIYGVEGHSGAVGIVNAEVNRRNEK